MQTLNCYLVGGAVRDKLLGLTVKDRDWVVVGSDTNKMLALGFKQVGADFPVFLHPETSEEYALARTERKSGKGYQGFECNSSETVTLEEDLLRRDLTVNAIAEDIHGALIDPYHGAKDLQNRVLRHVSPAFSEDPLRVLRLARFAARFSALGFKIAEETLQLCRQISHSGELTHLSPERVWQETQTALTTNSPEVYFKVLSEVGALEILFPEIAKLFGVPQPEKYHPEIDCGVHALMSLAQATLISTQPSVRFAALIHDLGKALTPAREWPRHFGHEKTGLKPITALCRRIKAPKDFKDLALLCCEFHTHIHRAEELRADTALKVLKRCDAFRRPQRFEQILQVSTADARGRTGFEDSPYPQANLFRRYLQAATEVDVKSLVQQGFKGAELGEKIDLSRTALIKQLKKDAATESTQEQETK
jgi:tRNA nucleotidyltransferase (CCA-adding enzyme)